MAYLGKKKKTQKRRRKRSQLIIGPRFIVFAFFFWASLVTMAVGGAYVGYVFLDLPEISSINSYRPKQVTEVLDRNGDPIAYWYHEKRWVVPLSVMPEYLKDAFLAAEDARFYEHPGIDFIGIVRAAVKNLEAGTIIQGASTITQQVTRALLLSSERSWIRKIKEAILAWKIDHILSKDDILAIYLNHIYLGQGAYGVEAAARTYFNKHVWDLSLAESSLLAGLTQAPSKYNPLRHFTLAKKRQFYVLRRMAEEGFITEEDAKRAFDEKIYFQSYRITVPKGAEYFLQDLKKDLVRRYGEKTLFERGLLITTTLDPLLQERAFDVIKQGIEAFIKRHPGDRELKRNIRGALVAIKGATGEVVAMVGGLDFEKQKFNLATQSLIQPGSSFKPIVYSAAMEQGLILPNSVLVDEPIALPGEEAGKMWEPENFEHTYMGPITVRTALEYSRNVIAVKIAQLVGVDKVIGQARAMGITTPIPRNLSIALGSAGVRLIELVDAYSTFPNLGERVRPQMVLKIEDRDGNILERLQVSRKRAMSPVTAYEMLHLLRGVVENGTGRKAKALGVPAGGKTGTTDNYRDALFIGFTRDYVCGTWIGRSDRKSLGMLETGGRVACPVWTNFMKSTVHDASSHMEFDIPKGVIIVPVDRRTGEILTGIEGVDEKTVVWEALPQRVVPELKGQQGFFRIPDWLKHLKSVIPGI